MFKGDRSIARNQFGNTGSLLEEEFIGNVNSQKYKEMAYDFLHKNEADTSKLSKDEQFEQVLKRRELATQEFENTLDFKNKYINRSNSMKLVEQCQVGDPEHPAKFFAKRLYDEVYKEVNKDQFILKFFTATGGTHLDVAHKIDCYFKLYLREDKKEVACATIDLTQRSGKDTAKADVVMNISPESQEKCDPSKGNDQYDSKFFEETIAKISEKVVDSIINDYQRKN